MYDYIRKMTSGGRPEINRRQKTPNSAILNFISASRGHLKNVNTVHFRHPWPLGQKVVSQIFERWSSNRIIEGNVQGGLFFVA